MPPSRRSWVWLLAGTTSRAGGFGFAATTPSGGVWVSGCDGVGEWGPKWEGRLAVLMVQAREVVTVWVLLEAWGEETLGVGSVW